MPLDLQVDQEGDVLMQDPENKPHSGLNGPQSEWNEVPEHDAAAGDAIIPPRKGKRTVRTSVHADEGIELRSSDLANWRDNYLINMAEQTRKRQLGKEAHNAKIYAHRIVFEWGIGGELRNPALKALFSGSALAEAFQAKAKAARKTKRAGGTAIERDGTQSRAQELGERGEQLGLAVENLDDYGPQTNDYDVSTVCLLMRFTFTEVSI